MQGPGLLFHLLAGRGPMTLQVLVTGLAVVALLLVALIAAALHKDSPRQHHEAARAGHRFGGAAEAGVTTGARRRVAAGRRSGRGDT